MSNRRPKRTGFVRTVVRAFTVHHTLLAAAGVAYYCALAVVPLLIGVVAIYGAVVNPDEVAANLEPLTDSLPPEAAALLVTQLKGVASVGLTGSVVGLAISVFGLLWLISNAFNALVMSIRLAHERPSPHNWIQGRLFALTLSIGTVLVLGVLLAALLAVPQIVSDAGFGSAASWLIWVGRLPLVLIVGTLAQSFVYRIVLGPRPRGIRRYFGSFLASLVFVLGTVIMSETLSNVEQIESTFGTLGSVAVLMLWLYLSVSSILLGAEVDAALARDRGASPASAFITGEHKIIR